MDWIPVVFAIFKGLVLCTGMFYAIKWHYDQGKKDQDARQEARAVLRATGQVVIAFTVLLVGLGFVTFDLAKMIGLDLNY